MGDPILTGLPDCPEAKAMNAIVAILKTDPSLSRVDIQWQTWENDPTDEVNPTISRMPYIQLTPDKGSSKWVEESQHKADMTILIGLVVEGTHRNDIINLWGAIRGALFPQEATRKNHVQTLMSPLVANGELVSQPFSFTMNDSGTKTLSASGSLYLKIYVNT